MLRHAVGKSAARLHQRSTGVALSRRWYAAATSRQKRALDKDQIQGEPTATPLPTSTATPAVAGGGVGSDGGGSSAIPLAIFAALAAAGGGYYYYNSMEEQGQTTLTVAEDQETPKPKEQPAAEKAAATKSGKPDQQNEGANRVLQIVIPMNEGPRSAPPAPVAGHPEGGNRVTVESTRPSADEVAAIPTVSVQDSLKEIQAAIDKETSAVTKRAKAEVMKSFDATLFEGLDELSSGQLKARVIQLATEMKERTRWEALRLKEFLAMKEKETADKYLDVLQKQRLEFEGILARRLRELENDLSTKHMSELRGKENAIQEMVSDALKKLNEEHEHEKDALTQRIAKETSMQYDQAYTERMEAFKREAIAEMQKKVKALDGLTKKLKDLEAALESTKSYHEGSQQAHRLSAAALALAEKMETSKGAGVELEALKAVAGDDNVVAAALSSVPASIKHGVPTLPELQARFEKVLSKTRQAALVPAGQTGLEGQLAGLLFATLKFPPKPDDPVPENDKDAAEYILVRAREYVQFGDLERAVQQLDKLQGQAEFTVQGWKKDASDRVAIEQALKVIKMECALLNEKMSQPV